MTYVKPKTCTSCQQQLPEWRFSSPRALVCNACKKAKKKQTAENNAKRIRYAIEQGLIEDTILTRQHHAVDVDDVMFSAFTFTHKDGDWAGPGSQLAPASRGEKITEGKLLAPLGFKRCACCKRVLDRETAFELNGYGKPAVNCKACAEYPERPAYVRVSDLPTIEEIEENNDV